MESISNKLKKYGWALVLTLFTLTGWGQANNLKYQTAKHPDQVPKAIDKGSITQLTIRPAAKALLERVTVNKDTTLQEAKDPLAKVFSQSSLQLPVLSTSNNFKNRKYTNLVISRNNKNVPIFINGEQQQILTPIRSSTSRSIDYEKVAINFLKDYQEVLQLTNPTEEFKEQETIQDRQGNTHIKLQQYWNNIPVWNSQVVVHATSKGVYGFNGRYQSSLQFGDSTPKISKKKALDITKEVLGKDNCTLPEMLLQHLANKATEKVELVYAPSKTTNEAPLVWKVDISTKNLEHWQFIISAEDGEILKKSNQACHFNGPTTASAKDMYGVTQTINTYDNGEKYYLVDGSRPMFDPTSTVPGGEKGMIITADAQFSDSLKNLRYNTSLDNVWQNPAAVSAHHHAGLCYDYFQKTFNRNSIDGKGGNILSVINAKFKDNAAWNENLMLMRFGEGETNFKEGSLARSLDVTAHEMAHGVIRSSANLVSSFQSGALNESFADVFGVMVDREDWTLGEDIVNTSVYKSGALRNMKTPNNGVTKGAIDWQPAHMSEYLHSLEEEDRGGIHINSGIPNKAFYLFATAIGKEKAEQVYYKALTQYLVPTSEFIDCRLAVIAAAQELYSGTEADAAAAAFDEVGIIDASIISHEAELPAVEGLQYLLTQSTQDGMPVIKEMDFEKDTYTVKSQHTFNSRVSINEAGDIALFVGADQKLYIIDLTDDNPDTNTRVFADSLPDGSTFHKVAISRDGQRIALLTYPYQPSILLYDLAENTIYEFDAYAPEFASTKPEYLDVIQFDPTGQYLIYDAYNNVEAGESFWDLGIIHLWDNSANRPASGKTWKPFTNLLEGLSIGNPIFSNTSSQRIAFELYNQKDEEAYVVTHDLINTEKNTVEVIAQNNFYSDFSLLGTPCFSPKDEYVAYVTDKGQEQQYVTLQKLAADKISASGENTGIIFGQSPIWYARGKRNFVQPRPDFSATNQSGTVPHIVHFQDESTNTPLTWRWTFQGGIPAQSSEQHPIVTYQAPGRYGVRLIVSNGEAESSAIKLGYIEVLADSSCSAPTGLAAENVSYSAIQLIWDEQPGVNYYQTRLRVSGGEWNEGGLRGLPNTNWTAIPPCTTYEIQVRSGCTNNYGQELKSAYSPSIMVETGGCEEVYCYSFGRKWDNWINKVTFNDLIQTSGNNLGYGNYTDVSTTLKKEEAYELLIEPSYESAPDSTAYYSVWIDFNQDNDFEDSGEQLIQAIHNNSQILQAKITIPSTAKLGPTRMRISASKDQIPNPCDTGEFSEVEDYTVIIEEPVTALTLDASPSNIALPSEAGTTTIAVTTNTTWSAQTYDSWIKLSPMEGVNDGTITVSYESNPISIGRVAIITIRGEGGVASKKITLIQDGAKNTTTPPTSSMQITYVNQLATGENNGSSWKDAYINLQTALANTTEGEIWVAAGTYLPTTSTDPSISFKLKPNVSLYGGFSANGNPMWEDRAWETHTTILSGDIGTIGDNKDNTFHVVFIDNKTTFDTTVDGFTITGGNADYSGGGAQVGSAFNANSIFTFKNCLFQNNRSEYEGGAVSGDWLTLKIEDCQFKDNYSDYSGGAISFFGGHVPTQKAQLKVTNSTFTNNTSGYEGGAIGSYGFTRISKSTFLDNTADYTGGAVDFFSGHTPTQITQLQILNCVFKGNNTGYEGGAVGATGFSRILGSLFLDNTTDHEGGAISHSREDSLLVTNCTFAFNIAAQQGATISNFSWDSTFTLITNSVFHENQSGNNQLFDFSGAGIHADIAYSLIDANACPSGVTCGAGMIFDKISPFVDAESNDFRPTETGLLVNNGNNDYLIPNLSFDLAGTPRIIGDRIDIGAYEAVLSEGISAFPTTEITRNNAITYTATLFPNPTNQYATIQLQKAADTDISGIISNRDGQIIQHFVIPQGQRTQRIDLMDYPAGVYWAKLMGENIAMPTLKLVIVE